MSINTNIIVENIVPNAVIRQTAAPPVTSNNSNNNRPVATSTDLQPPPSSISFKEMLLSVIGQNNKPPKEQQQQQHNDKKKDNHNMNTAPQQSVQSQPVPKRACRAPLSRKFAHPCTCTLTGTHYKNPPSSYVNANNNHNNNYNGTLPSAANVPLHLYDPATKKCLPTSRTRDMLLKECRLNVASPYPLPHQLYHGAPCVYDDLICDARRNRCICKPPLHLYYESNSSAFGCVPMGPTASLDGRINCKSGQIYNVISKECQKIFDVNELPPTYTTGVSATQFSFVTIVLIWILLLILIVTAKLRKLRTTNMYRNTPPTSERRQHNRSGSLRHQGQGGASAWLHPFIAAVNGHHHLNQHRTTVDRHSQAVDDSGNFNDTDFFLANGNRRLNELFSDGAFAGSQQSLNNPPPKFEEIYPSCPEEVQQQQVMSIQPPPSNEDLPTYDEAMKLQNTMPPDLNQKE